jgi:UDP-N-acetylmuramoyl-L-alanyl-D-glutamate--2,6-diaminopimelate ligase
VLKTLRGVTSSRLICVFGAGGERDREKRPLMGRAVEQAANIAILTNDNPRHENPGAIFRDVLQGCCQPNLMKVVPDRQAAIERALSMAEPGDCVLIAGKGHEKYQMVGNERVPLDDCDVARRWLYGR